MSIHPYPSAVLVLCLLAIAIPATAQTVLSGDHSVDGTLCVGADCSASETFGFATQKLKEDRPVLRFEDTSTLTGEPKRDWELHANALIGTGEYFGLFDAGSNKMVFRAEADAFANSLYIGKFGLVGMGTSLPENSLHLVAGTGPGIRFETTNSAQKWDIATNGSSFFVVNTTSGQNPFLVSSDAQSAALAIAGNNSIGMGTFTPSAPLELSTSNSFNFFRITAQGAAVNDSVDITYTGGPLGTGQLRYNIVDGDNQEMSLDADGNMVLDGTLTTSGPSCAGGCDRVFEADYALKSIKDHQAQMWADGYLPNVGPTPGGGPLNVSDKIGGILNELEHAHIYIGQLHGAVQEERKRADRIEAQLAQVMANLDGLLAENAARR